MPPSSFALRRTPAFANLPPAALDALARCCRERRYATGEVVFREGDPGASLLLVAEGELAVSTVALGVARTFARAVPGQILGESALCDPAPRAATVTAARPSVVWALDAEAVEVLRGAAPEAARALLAAAIGGVIRRLHQLEQRALRELERGAALP